MSGETLWRQEQRKRGAAAREKRARIAEAARQSPSLTREDLATRFHTNHRRVEYALAKHGLKRPLHAD